MRYCSALIILIITILVSPALAGYTIGTVHYGNGTQFVVSTASSVGTVTNYPINITLSNATGVSSSTAIYTNGTTNATWFDLTVTNETDYEISFWIENKTQTSTTAILWINAPSITTTGNVFRIYFGNSSVTAPVANYSGLNTFSLFDDFNAANSTKWLTTGSPTYTASTIKLAGTGAYVKQVSLQQFGSNTSMRAYGLIENSATGADSEGLGYTASGTFTVNYPRAGVLNAYIANSTDAISLGTSDYAGNRSWSISRPLSTSNVTFHVNGTQRASILGTTATANISIAAYANTHYSIYDWIFVRAYTYPEPTTSAYGGIGGSSNITSYVSQDIWLEGEYLQTFVVTDATTDMPINNVTITDSDGDTTTTASNGTAWLSEPFGADTVLFTATSYDAKTVAYVFDSNATHYVELSPSSTDTNYTGPDVTTYPKYVTFHIKEGFGNPVQDVNVSILAVSTSTGNWDWVLTLLGIPLDEVAVNGTEMYQTTDSMGTATFYVIPTAKYNVTFTKTGYTISSMVLVPQDDDYIIWAEGTGASFYENDYDELAMVNISVQTAIINDTHAFINMSYNDTLAHTTGGFINVTQKNASPWGAPVTVASFPAVSSSFTNSTIITHTGQVSGSVACNVSHTDFGQVERSSPWSLKGEAVHFLGFGSDIALLVALGIMMLTVMLAGAVHARHTVVAMAFEGWIFYAIDWFAALEARGVSETVILLALTLLTILGFVAHFEVRKRKEKY